MFIVRSPSYKAIMKYLKYIKNIVYYFLIILLVFVCLVTATSIFEIPGGYRFFVVESGSMEPSILTNSIILIRKESDYRVGDVVTFNPNPGASFSFSTIMVTHRINEIKNDPQKGELLITKGDANQTPDSEPIKREQIAGKVLFNFPYLGYPIKFAKTQLGFIALVIIPGTLIIYSELINIKNEIKKIFTERKKKKLEKEKELMEKSKLKPKKKSIKKKGASKKKKSVKNLLVLFITVSSYLFTISSTQAYYNNTESSENNVIGVGTWEDTSIPEVGPGDIVVNEVFYDVDPAHGEDGNTPQSDEWIELYNNLDYEVSLQNWTITDNTETRIIHANKTIPAKGFAVIAKDAQTWTYWSIPDSAEKIELGQIIGGGLSNDGDRVILKNPSNTEIDAVSWGADTYAFTPSVTDVVEGHSISRITKGVDTNTALDWMDTFSGSAPPGPNPGTNPHNEEGTLIVPTASPTPTPIVEVIDNQDPVEGQTASTESAQMEPEPEVSPSPTPTPEISPSPTASPEEEEVVIEATESPSPSPSGLEILP